MVDSKLDGIIRSYNLDYTINRKTHSVEFVQIVSRSEPWLQLNVQYVNGDIYCIYFLNNQFFEIKNEHLYQVIKSILEGDYVIERSRIFKKYSIKLKIGGTSIYPERITSGKKYVASYLKLPIAF